MSLINDRKVRSQEDMPFSCNPRNLPVTDFVVMQVAESIESLAHDKGGLCFSQVLLLSDEEEKFTTFTEPKFEMKISIQFRLV